MIERPCAASSAPASTLKSVTDSKGNPLETEQKYDADANFVLPELGHLPGAPADTVPGAEPLAWREIMAGRCWPGTSSCCPG